MTLILNISKYTTILSLVIVGLMLVSPSFVNAVEYIGGGAGDGAVMGGGAGGGAGVGGGGGDGTPKVPSVSLESPLKNIGSIEGLLVAILNIVIILMIPVIVFFIILAGFKYVTAQGNASQVEDATRSLTYAIIGGVLILGAVALSQIIANVVKSF